MLIKLATLSLISAILSVAELFIPIPDVYFYYSSQHSLGIKSFI